MMTNLHEPRPNELPLAFQLKSIGGPSAGAFTKDVAGGVVLTVNDKQKWNDHFHHSKIESIKKLFWPLIQKAYDRQDREFKEQLEITFKDVDKVFVRASGSDIIGFCCMETDSTDPSVGILRDIIVKEAYRQQGFGRELYGTIFSDTAYNAIISATTTLPAILNRFAVGKTHGFETYFGNMVTGHPDAKRLIQLDMDYLKGTGVLMEDELNVLAGNEGLVLTTPNYILPLQPEEIGTLPDGLKQEAENIVALQKKVDEAYGKGTRVVSAHLISVRTPLATEKTE